MDSTDSMDSCNWRRITSCANYIFTSKAPALTRMITILQESIPPSKRFLSWWRLLGILFIVTAFSARYVITGFFSGMFYLIFFLTTFVPVFLSLFKKQILYQLSQCGRSSSSRSCYWNHCNCNPCARSRKWHGLRQGCVPVACVSCTHTGDSLKITLLQSIE